MLQFHCHCFSLYSGLLAVLGIHTLASVSLSLFLPLFQVVGQFWESIHLLQFHCHCFSLYSRSLDSSGNPYTCFSFTVTVSPSIPGRWTVLGIHTLASVSLSLFLPLFQVVGSSGNPYTCFSFTVTVSPSIPGCWQFWDTIHLLQFHCHCFSLYSRPLDSSGNPYTCFSFTVTVSPSIPGCWQLWDTITCFTFTVTFSLHYRLMAVLGIHTLASVSLSLSPSIPGCLQLWDTIQLFHCHFLPLFQVVGSSGTPYTCFTFTATFSLHYKLLAALGHHTIASVSLSLSPSIPGCWQLWDTIHLLHV